MMKSKTSVVYLVMAPDTRQNEVIQVFMQTFKDSYDCAVDRMSFPIGKLFCYIYINDQQNKALLRVRATPVDSLIEDVQLAIYQDIATIPLMHSAIKASKSPVE